MNTPCRVIFTYYRIVSSIIKSVWANCNQHFELTPINTAISIAISIATSITISTLTSITVNVTVSTAVNITISIIFSMVNSNLV